MKTQHFGSIKNQFALYVRQVQNIPRSGYNFGGKDLTWNINYRPTARMSTLIRKLISSSNAAKPVAPYNQAVVADRTVYVSGCLGLDKCTMKLVPGGAVEQATMALKNLEAVLIAADSGIDKVVKNTIYLKDINDFAAINEVYKKVFTKDFPARSCFQVAKLPMDALVEIESIAMTGDIETVTCED